MPSRQLVSQCRETIGRTVRHSWHMLCSRCPGMKTTKKRALRALAELGAKLETARTAEDLQQIVELSAHLRALVETAALADAVRLTRGNLYQACEAIGVPHRTGARWVAARPSLAREVESARKVA